MDPLDGYLLDGRPGKAEAIEAALAAPSDEPRAQPFYRALRAVGANVADDALLALRLVLGGGTADDDGIRAARAARADVLAGNDPNRTKWTSVMGAIGQ